MDYAWKNNICGEIVSIEIITQHGELWKGVEA